MRHKLWLNIISVIVVLFGIVSLIIFLWFQEYTVTTTINSCSEKGMITETGTYRFIPQWGWESYKILIINDNGGMFDSTSSGQLCDDKDFIHAITAIEHNGFGYITALYVKTMANQYSSSYKVMNINELTQAATMIVTGVVGDVRMVKENTNDPLIYTYFTIQPQQYLKGVTTASIIIMRQLGGTVDDVTTTTGEVMLQTGKQYLLFLKSDVNNTYSIIGGPQGVYTIENNAIVEQDTAKRVLNKQRKVTLQDFITVVQ